MIERTKILAITIIRASWELTSRMLPNKKLKRSNENPPDRLTKMTPMANPEESRMATAESGGIVIESLNLVMPNPASTVKINAVHIGYRLRKRPSDNPPNATCDIASPNKECFLSTRNKPMTEDMVATAMPAIIARCMNPY